jgi:Family of unknown function (DUF5677)
MTNQQATTARWEFEPGRDPGLNREPGVAGLLAKNQSLSERLRAAVSLGAIDLVEGLSHPQRAVTGMLAKAFKTHRAVLLLAQAGYGEDAHALVRSLFELAVYARVIATDATGEMAERWIDFAVAESYELLRMARSGRFPSLHELHEVITAHPGEFADVERRAQEIQEGWRFWRVRKSDGEWILDGHWSGMKGLRELAESVGWAEQYALTQTIASQEIHGTSASVAGYIRDTGDELVIDGSPSVGGVAVALSDAEPYLTAVIEVWADAMEVREHIRGALGLNQPR